MLTQNKLQKGEGTLKSDHPEARCIQRRRNMENEEALWKEEQNFRKVFYNMADKVDKLFSEYEKAFGHKKKDVDDNRS